MNARERRTIRIGVAIGTVVGLIGCGQRPSNLQGAGHAPTLSSEHIKSVEGAPNAGIATFGYNATDTSEHFIVQGIQTVAP